MPNSNQNSDAASTKPEMTRDESVARLAKDIKGIRMAMLTTADQNGVMHSRPMGTQEADFDGDLWFFTKLDSGKVYAIEKDQNVNVAYANPDDSKYISVTGRADIVTDKASIEKYWSPMMKAWFPEGKDDPQIALIKITIDNAEVWDSASSKFVQLFALAKATLTGKEYAGEGSRHEKINLRH